MAKLVFLTLTALLFISGCAEEIAPTEQAIRSVKTITISETNQANSRQLSGVVKNIDESAISFRVGGRVTDVNAKIGDFVTRGQLLAQIEPREYELKVNSARAKLSAARSDLSEKLSILQRQKNLREKGFVAQAALEQAQASFDSAKGNVDVAETDLENSLRDLSETQLKAPFDGTISSRSIEPFTEVSAGETMFEVLGEDAFKVEVLMPETIVRDVSSGDPVIVNFPTLGSTQISGSVFEIGSKAQDGNAFPVSVELASNPPEVLSGMTASVTFNFGELPDTPVYLIPVSALDLRITTDKKEENRNAAPVFVLESGVVTRRTVMIRDIRGNELEVVEGLVTGDELIVAGIPFIQEGQEAVKWQPTYNIPATLK